jgi:hypothetical protein
VLHELNVHLLLDVLNRVLLDDLGQGHTVGTKLLLGLLETIGGDRLHTDRVAGCLDVGLVRLATHVDAHSDGVRLKVVDVNERLVVDVAGQFSDCNRLGRKNPASERVLAKLLLDVKASDLSNLVEMLPTTAQCLTKHVVEFFTVDRVHN